MRLYRFLLRLYPPKFRALFAEEMVELLRDRLRAERRKSGLRGASRIWWRTLTDLLGSAVKERFESTRLPSRGHPRRSRYRGGNMSQDLRYAWRALVARPAVTAAIVLTLGVGIGANGVIVTIIDTVLYGGFACEDPERIVVVSNRYGTSATSSSPPDFTDRRDQTQLLDAVAAVRSVGMSLSGVGVPEQVRVAPVTASFFEVMRIEGLTVTPPFPHEEAADVERLAVLSGALSQRLFGDKDPSGETVRLDGESYRVVSVLPTRFDFPKDTDLWVPLQFTAEELADDNRGNEYLSVVGRMKAGVAIETARAEMEAIAKRVIESVPDRADFLSTNAWGASVEPFTDALVGDFREQLFLLWAAVTLVLVIVCANVANVLLAVAEGRSVELSMKMALGATRGRLSRQLFAESLLLGLAGAGLAIVLAALCLSTLVRWVPHDLPGLELARLDAGTVAAIIAIAFFTSVLFGILPAWRGSKLVFARRHSKLRQGLVVAEVGVAVVLLVSAGGMLESFRELSGKDTGFHPDERMSFRVSLPRTAYPDRDSRRAFGSEMLGRLRAMPGVDGAASSFRLPLDGETWTATFYPEGFDFGSGQPAPGADFNVTSPGYPDALGIPLLDGRDFDDSDREEGRKTVLVDARLAETFWPRGGAVGSRLNFSGPNNPPDFREIVGVVGHVLNDGLDSDARMQIYVPAEQSPQRSNTFTLRSRRSPTELAEAIREEVRGVDAALPIYQVRPVEAIVQNTLALPRFNLRILGGFALMALALSGLGIYSVLSTNVNARTSEIGLRVALGADRASVFGWVLKEALGLTAVGMLFGGVTSLGLIRWLSAQTLAISPIELGTLATMTAVIVGVALAAAMIPARRAVRLDPVRALKADGR